MSEAKQLVHWRIGVAKDRALAKELLNFRDGAVLPARGTLLRREDA